MWGGLAQGPEEKRGFAGRVAGLVGSIDPYPSRYMPLVGEGCPTGGDKDRRGISQVQNCRVYPGSADITCVEAGWRPIMRGQVRATANTAKATKNTVS